jgi:3-methyladenine DNA glycosylase AlkD
MNATEILGELNKLGNAQTKKILMSHGAREPVFGVKVEDLKKIQKRVKKDYQLALHLFDTGNSDAMYLAGLIADEARMTRKDLQRWVAKAYWPWLSEYTVPWVASEISHGRELALEWIESKKENVAASGWATYSSLVSIKDDAELDLDEIKKLLMRVEKTIHDQPNRVRYVMNGFIIAVGAFVKPLTADAQKTAKAIGTVNIDMNGTACKVPSAPDYIKKMHDRGTLGRKRKSARC